VAFSFLVCNLGLNAILSISIPILNAIYPVSIMLILLGLFNRLWLNNRFVYPLTIGATGCVSVMYALDTAGVPLGAVGTLFRRLPLYTMGFCWVSVAAAALLLSLVLARTVPQKH
jgi:LIVCS family branched-chain amino acid:cation transporter